MQIDKEATHEKVREAYGSVGKFSRACGTYSRIYYQAVSEGRGRVQVRSTPAMILDRLRREGLLVELP